MRIAFIALMAVLLVGCGAAETPSPTATTALATIHPTSEPSASPVPPASSVTDTPEPLPVATPMAYPTREPDGIVIGDVTVTVVDDLRVRSQPQVSEDSVKYVPTLPAWTT